MYTAPGHCPLTHHSGRAGTAEDLEALGHVLAAVVEAAKAHQAVADRHGNVHKRALVGKGGTQRRPGERHSCLDIILLLITLIIIILPITSLMRVLNKDFITTTCSTTTVTEWRHFTCLLAN
jgi:hypothetical protein